MKACIDNRQKGMKQQYLLHRSSQYGELRPTNGWDLLAGLAHPPNFHGFRILVSLYCTDVTQRKSTKLCTMFGRLLGWYTIYRPTLLGLLMPRNGILPGAKFTLRASLGFSYIGNVVTARHSSSGRQANFAAFSRGSHLYSADRPTRWASAHILVCDGMPNLPGVCHRNHYCQRVAIV